MIFLNWRDEKTNKTKTNFLHLILFLILNEFLRLKVLKKTNQNKLTVET
jgi:hypothetical protein